MPCGGDHRAVELGARLELHVAVLAARGGCLRTAHRRSTDAVGPTARLEHHGRDVQAWPLHQIGCQVCVALGMLGTSYPPPPSSRGSRITSGKRRPEVLVSWSFSTWIGSSYRGCDLAGQGSPRPGAESLVACLSHPAESTELVSKCRYVQNSYLRICSLSTTLRAHVPGTDG